MRIMQMQMLLVLGTFVLSTLAPKLQPSSVLPRPGVDSALVHETPSGMSDVDQYKKLGFC